ncbi:MAG: glycosyltransferase [Asticcacaulis sp.]
MKAAPEGVPVLGTLGRLHVNKGLDIAIRAVAILKAQGVRLALRIAGDGPEQQVLARLAGELGVHNEVRFDGWVDETADYLNSLGPVPAAVAGRNRSDWWSPKPWPPAAPGRRPRCQSTKAPLVNPDWQRFLKPDGLYLTAMSSKAKSACLKIAGLALLAAGTAGGAGCRRRHRHGGKRLFLAEADARCHLLDPATAMALKGGYVQARNAAIRQGRDMSVLTPYLDAARAAADRSDCTAPQLTAEMATGAVGVFKLCRHAAPRPAGRPRRLAGRPHGRERQCLAAGAISGYARRRCSHGGFSAHFPTTASSSWPTLRTAPGPTARGFCCAIPTWWPAA